MRSNRSVSSISPSDIVVGVTEAIEAAGGKLCRLPPHWPVLNPVELAVDTVWSLRGSNRGELAARECRNRGGCRHTKHGTALTAR
ncbi:MAG: hypothetical protein ABFC63_00230 [Thermoguttaceae bacterium]